MDTMNTNTFNASTFEYVQCYFESLPVYKQAKCLLRFRNLTLWAFDDKDAKTIMDNPDQLLLLKKIHFTFWCNSVLRFKNEKMMPTPLQPLEYDIGWQNGLKRHARKIGQSPGPRRDEKILLDSLVIPDETMTYECMYEWPKRYVNRFCRWYLRRNNSQDLQALIKQNCDDFIHHVTNWDSGLRKSLIKDNALNKLRNQLRNDRKTERKASAKFLKEAIMDPKTCTVTWTAIDEIDNGEEQADGQQAQVLENVATTSQTSNITFVDERPVDTTTLHTSGDVSTRDIHCDIAEKDWTLARVLEREYPLTNIEWKVNDTFGKMIYTNGVPKLITDDLKCMITRQLQFFSFLRAGIKIRVQLNGTKFHCGRLIVYFKPLTWNDDTEDNFYSVTCYPHFFLDASVSNSGELTIPFTHLLSYFSQQQSTLFSNTINTLGSLNIKVFNPLQAPTNSSQSLYGQIYASLVAPSVHLPTSNITGFSYGNGYMQGLEGLLKRTAGSVIDTGIGLADKFTGGLVTGAGDALCNLLGVGDKPTDPVSASPIVNRTVGPLSHGAGLDRSIRLGLSPTAQTNTSPNALGATDCDFNLLTLCKLPCLLDQKDWTTTHKTGVKLFDMLVTPVFISQPQRTAEEVKGLANYNPTMLAYISRAFCLWRGTLKVKIQVVATQFHSGRLALVYDPHGNSNINFKTLEDNKSHNIIIVDIQEKQEIVVELPNFMVKPWLRCDKLRSDLNLDTGGTVLNPSYLDCDSAGIFRIFVLNSLVRPDNVTDKVQVNVFFYAGDNFELSIPNPVAPLSARRGKDAIQYLNEPRYPWCTTVQGEPQLCEYYEAIMNLYYTGQELFSKGYLNLDVTWYRATEKVFNADTLCFVYEGKKIKYYMEFAGGPCADLIKSLPNYTQHSWSDSCKELTEKVDAINTNVQKIEPRSDKTLVEVNNIKHTSDTVDVRTQNMERNIGNISRDTFYTLKFDECYKKIEDDSIISYHPTQCSKGEEQSIESYTTTRESEGGAVCITDGNRKAQVAPDTISENAMNMQTLLRRFYPLWVSSNINHSNNFTLITIPVSPSFVPGDEDTILVSRINRRYEIHNLAWWSRLYTYWRGSMRYKVLVNCDDADIYVWHNPVDVKDFHITSGFSYEHVTEQLNFASEVAITRVQQGIEVEVPFYSSFNQLLHSHISNKTDLRAQNGTLYIAVRNRSKDFNISTFVSTGDDFFLNVLRAPPIIHEPSVHAYVDSHFEDGNESTYPDLQKSLGHQSGNTQIPGTFVFNRWNKGNFRNCDIPPFAPEQDFKLNKLTDQSQQTLFKGEEQGLFSNLVGTDEVVDIGRDITEQFRGINANLSSVNSKLPSVMELIDTLKRDIPKVVNVVTAEAHSITDVANFGKWATNLLMIGTFVADLASILHEFTWLKLVKLVIIFCLYMKVEFHKIINWLTTQVQQIYEGYRPKANDGDVAMGTEQSFMETLCEKSDQVVMTMSALATVIFCAIFGKLPSWIAIKNFCKETIFGKDTGHEQGLMESLRSVHFSVLGIKAISSAYEFFSTWIEKFVAWAIGKECKELEMVRAFQEKSQAVIDWLDEIELLDVDDVILDALTDEDLHNKIYSLIDIGREFTKWTMQDKVQRNIACVIRDANKKLMDLVKRINANRPGKGFRYSPFVVMFDGPSSIAKTNVMHEFTDMFREELKIPYYNSVYPVPTTAKYLDGYTGNAIVEWDDILQSPEQDVLVAEFINWRSNADFKPNMASVEEKGKIHFLSKVIEMTTNSGNININTIRDMNAFRNRINIKFECHLAPGWNVARVKALPVKDNDYTFMLFDAYFTGDDGTTFELYRRDMSFVDARELTRLHFMRWDEKQNNLVAEYLATHGDLRIPKGVQLRLAHGEQQMKSFEEYEDPSLVYKTMSGDFEFLIEDDLSEEEDDEAEMFKYEFDNMEFNDKKRFYEVVAARDSCKKNLTEMRACENGRTPWWTLIKRTFKRGCDAVSNMAKDLYLKYPNLITGLGLIAAIGTSLALFISMKKLFWKDENVNEELLDVKFLKTQTKPTMTSEMYEPVVKTPKTIVRAEMYEPVIKTPKQIVRAEMYEPRVKMPKHLVRAEGTIQGCADVEATQMGRNKIHPLLYTLGWAKSDHQVQLQGLAIGGKVLLTPYHFFRKAKVGDFFFFLRGMDKIIVEYLPERLYRVRDKDCALYYVGPTFDSRKSILNCFIKETDLNRIGKKINAVLIGTTSKGILMEKPCVAENNSVITYKGSDDGAEEFVQVGWRYLVDTLKGECGSVLVACSTKLPPPAKVIGLHTAGYTSCRGGFSIVITQEQIAETLNVLLRDHGQQVFNAPLPIQVSTDEVIFEEQAKPKPEGAFTYWGTMDPKFCPQQPLKTCFKPTPFHEEIFPSLKKPAHLLPYCGISPLTNALTKYGKLTLPFQHKHIKIVKASILNDLLQFSSDLPHEPASLENTIFGADGVDHCKIINMSSSPGWPYQCLPAHKGQMGKAYLFDLNKRIISDKLLLKNFNDREENAKLGQRVASIWRDCLKDELRPNEKVDQCKTRLFTIAPVDFTLLSRKYFLAFEQMFYKNHTKFFSAVGIAPESYEWTVAYNRLRSYGNMCCAGDFSSFDGTLMPDLIYETGEIINDWYKSMGEQDPHATIVRRTLIDELIHTNQLVNNCVYKTHQGNPSGNSLTVIINTIVNAFYMRLCWMEIMTDSCKQMATMEEYNNNVIEEIYGDDNRLVIRQRVIHLFNQLSITERLAAHGIIYTSETKEQTDLPFRRLEETTFLKRGYRWDPEIGKEIALPIIDISTISEIINWYRDTENIEEQFLMNMKAALEFSFFYGRDFYEKLLVKYQQKLRENGIKPISTTYDEQLDRFLDLVHGEDTQCKNFIDLGY